MTAAGAQAEVNASSPRALLALLFGYLLLKPVYFFPSGYPQPADGLLCLAALVALFVKGAARPAPIRSVTAVGIVFAGYMSVVNLCWSLLLSDAEILAYATYYAFNGMLFVVVLKAMGGPDPAPFRWVGYATAAGLVIQALASVLVQHVGAFRQTVLFNNPNQLGYWALLSATIFLLCSSRVRFGFWVQLAAMMSSAYATALSLSKAAMISLVVLYCLHVVKNPRLVLAVFIVAAFGIGVLGDSEIADNVMTRLQNIGQQSDDSAAGRGYDRIWEYPDYLILGAGEGGYDRFPGVFYELHSTIGTVLFSYGLVGFGLFCYWLLKTGVATGYAKLTYIFPLLLYGITHQGLRFSLFWFVLALIVAVGSAERRPSTAPAAG